MSRIGKQPLGIPSGVKVAVQGLQVNVEGPKGKLSLNLRPEVQVAVEGASVKISRKNESKFAKSLHGTARAILATMIEGVTKGYQRNLDIVGVGWQGKVQGKMLTLQVGFCHTVDLTIPEGVKCVLPNPQRIEITGISKQAVGQFASQIRASRKPEPYKGKGIRYSGEKINMKEAKKA